MSPPPRSLGPYQLLQELGRGGMGRVYRARDPRLDREVALKTLELPPGLDHDELLRRFEREAEVLARLRHPHVVRVHDLGVEHGRPYLVMDLLPGGSLGAELKRRGPLPCERLAELLAQAAEGLEHAHQAGVLHRDLKPDNLLLDAAGQAVISDFGLARALWGGRLTHSGEVLGTPGFMAPEQALGAGQLGPACDVYGLGACGYALLTGAPPFQGGSVVQVLRQVIEDAPRPPRERRPDLDPELERILLRCLEKDPARRYGSAAELARALRSWRAHGSPSHRSLTRRAGRLLALVGGVLVLALGAALLTRPSAPTTAAAPSPVTAVSSATDTATSPSRSRPPAPPSPPPYRPRPTSELLLPRDLLADTRRALEAHQVPDPGLRYQRMEQELLHPLATLDDPTDEQREQLAELSVILGSLYCLDGFGGDPYRELVSGGLLRPASQRAYAFCGRIDQVTAAGALFDGGAEAGGNRDPRSARVHLAIAQLQLLTPVQLTSEMHFRLGRALARDPSLALAYYVKAHFHWQDATHDRDPALVRDSLRHALALDPDFPRARAELAWLLLEGAPPPPSPWGILCAQLQAQALLDASPADEPETVYTRACLARARGDLHTARALADQAVDLVPDWQRAVALRRELGAK